MKHVLTMLAAIAVFLGMTATTASSGETISKLKPYTLVQAGKYDQIVGFAQDGNYVAWMGYSHPCYHSVKLRNLSTRKTLNLSRPNGPSCKADSDVYLGQIAIAGNRAVWSSWTGSPQQYGFEVMTASPTIRETSLSRFGMDHPEEEDWNPPAVPMAGANKTLVFAKLYGGYDHNLDSGIRIVRGNRAVPLKGTEDTVLLAATKRPWDFQRDRFVGVRVTKWSEWRRKPLAWEVTIYGAPFGRSYSLDKPVKALAARTTSSATHFVLLTDSHIDYYAGEQGRKASWPVPKNTASELGFMRGRVVFRTGRTIRILNLGSRHTSVLTVAEGKVHGLSTTKLPLNKGYRVAWIEGKNRIRAINLP
jgi:hypothetical protein